MRTVEKALKPLGELDFNLNKQGIAIE